MSHLCLFHSFLYLALYYFEMILHQQFVDRPAFMAGRIFIP